MDQGFTVFMISWVNPDERLAKKTFENYMTEGPLTALDVVEELDLYAGARLDPSTRHRLEDADQKWSARQAALNLLSYRPRSEQELRSYIDNLDLVRRLTVLLGPGAQP